MILVPFYTLWRLKASKDAREKGARIAEDFVLFRVKVFMCTTLCALYALTLDHGPKTFHA
jgi:hypothetical protein